MDIKPQAQQSISDDQELAKVLAGINESEDTAIPAPPVVPDPPVADPATATPVVPVADTTPVVEPAAISTPPAEPIGSDNLASIKQEALGELRPLVDKLNVSPEEKFDTYLLLIRSTDDQSLVAPAHTAAQAITDETKRAQALLDIIKEIDYLSNPPQQQ